MADTTTALGLETTLGTFSAITHPRFLSLWVRSSDGVGALRGEVSRGLISMSPHLSWACLLHG